ncbi:MAG: hypothetical protein ACFCUE_02235 [Candidatus Bathyarchaeia archaeon]|jgi:hypothetical protein
MQLPTFLIETLKSGKITVSERNVPQMEINVDNKKIDVNVTDKELIKDVMSSARKSATHGGVLKTIKKGIDTLKAADEARPLVKSIVEDFCKEGITITVSYKGARAITVGSEADSKLTRLVTGTKGIQIDSPIKLAEMTT